MAKRMHIILVAVVTMLLCAAMIVTGTYALFTDSYMATTHLKAGTMKIRMVRTKLVSYTGYGDPVTNNDQLIYAGIEEDETLATENIFGLGDENDLLVPTSQYTATIQLENKSDVAFNYYIQIQHRASNDFAHQAKITVDVTPENAEDAATSETTYSLADSFFVGSTEKPIAQVTVGGASTFSVSILFPDVEGNNKAQGLNADFDLTVYAVQATGALS